MGRLARRAPWRRHTGKPTYNATTAARSATTNSAKVAGAGSAGGGAGGGAAGAGKLPLPKSAIVLDASAQLAPRRYVGADWTDPYECVARNQCCHELPVFTEQRVDARAVYESWWLPGWWHVGEAVDERRHDRRIHEGQVMSHAAVGLPNEHGAHVAASPTSLSLRVGAAGAQVRRWG